MKNERQEPKHSVDGLAATLKEVSPTLDDLSRARISARLRAEVAKGAPQPVRSEVRTAHRGRWVARAGVCAAAAIALWVLAPRKPATRVATQAPADASVAAPPRASVSEASSLLHEGATFQARDGAEVVARANEDGSELHLRSGTVHVRAASAGTVTVIASEISLQFTKATVAASRSSELLQVDLADGEIVVLRDGHVSETLREPGTYRFPFAVSPSEQGEPATGETEPSEGAVASSKGKAPASQSPRETARTLYDAAEERMAKGDTRGASAVLERLISEFPRDSRADDAKLDLARIAHRSGDLAKARGYLTPLVAHRGSISQAAHHLLCRIEMSTDEAEALACIAEFRANYPTSSRDRELLATQIALAYRQGGCAAARPLLAQLTANEKNSDANGLASLVRRCAADASESF